MNLLWLAAGVTSMTAAFDRGDLDEVARQGEVAGPVVVEHALGSKVRSTVLAAIVAAPAVEDRAELLPALAHLAEGADRRTSVPAARAARAIAQYLARHELADDLAPDDVASWRASFEAIARREHPIEVRVAALETAAALAHVLDPADLGFDLAAALADRDPALRITAIELVPRPLPATSRAPLATAITGDVDPAVALAAAQVLCADLADDPAATRAALGERGLERIRTLVTDHPAARDAARCLH